MFVCNIHMQVNILIFITCIYMYIHVMKVYELFICMLKYTTQPFQSCNRHIFKIIITTPTLIKHIMCEVWLSITDATECSFFATFWTSWSNLTVTSTLLTNYCKHSIHSSLQANGIFHLFSQHSFLSH